MPDDPQIPSTDLRPKSPSKWRKRMISQPDEKARRGFRFPAGVAAELHHPEGSSPCGAENLSRTGVLLVGPVAPPADGRVDLTLKDRTGSHEVRVTGRVIRVTHDEAQDEVRIAVEFSELGDEARDGLEVLLARLLESQPTGGLDSLKPGTPPHEIRKVLEAIPLPQRMALAGRAGPKEREFIRYDSHPAVLEALVRNSGLSLAEGRLVAASPYLAPGTIDALAVDPRFARDEEFRSALAINPKTPPPTADRVLEGMKPQQIRALMARPGVQQAMRDKLFKKLTRN